MPIARPILLENLCKTDRWGGANLQKIFGIESPYQKTSEVWTASAHEKGETWITIINEGIPEVVRLSDFYKENESKRIFGTNCLKYDKFPLLAKWIDANDNLSVQVHPDDEYAKKNKNSYGKCEAWYIVSAKPGAQIVYGLKSGTTRERLEKAISEDRIADVLNFIPVKEGEVYYIPAGMVHALLDGVIVYEIQQSSNITYRLYDWDRNDDTRPLSVSEALNVIKFSENDYFINTCIYKKFRYLKTPHFDFYTQKVKGNTYLSTQDSSFKLCTVLKGTVNIIGWEGDYKEKVTAGNSFILPAPPPPISTLWLYPVFGNAKLFVSTVN